MKQNEDIPLQRSLRIGKATVGLIGLDVALARVLGVRELDEEQAVDMLMDAVGRENYIPDSARDQYREALHREYLRLKEGSEREHGELSIKILGKACSTCNKLNTMAFDVLQEMGIAADIKLIHDPDEIYRHGVLVTPALIINDQVVSAGRLPSRSKVEEFLKAAIDNC